MNFTTEDNRLYLTLCHGMAFLGVILPGVGFIFGPLIIWLWKKNTVVDVDEHGKAAMNFQLSCFIYGAIGAILIPLGIGLLILWLLGIFWLVCVIMAMVKSLDNRLWKYPLSIRFIK
ncbi:MAG: DUF4870 domain-containing protein [Cellvibrionaceae bacterium]